MEKYIFQEQVGMIREKIRNFPQSTAVDQYQGGPVRVKPDSSNGLKPRTRFRTRLVLEHSYFKKKKKTFEKPRTRYHMKLRILEELGLRLRRFKIHMRPLLNTYIY